MFYVQKIIVFRLDARRAILASSSIDSRTTHAHGFMASQAFQTARMFHPVYIHLSCQNFSHGPFQTDRCMRNVLGQLRPPAASQTSEESQTTLGRPHVGHLGGRSTGANFKNIFHKFLKALIKNHRSTWYVLTSSDTPNFGFEIYLLLISWEKCHKLFSW